MREWFEKAKERTHSFRYVYALSFIFTFTIAFLSIGLFRSYSAEVMILTVLKSEKAAISSGQIIENIAELPKTLDFYNRMTARFPEIRDSRISRKNVDRKEYWTERISTERIQESGLIRLRIDGVETEDEAGVLVEKSAATLFFEVGRYYDIRNDIDVRVIEPMISKVEIKRPFVWILTSVFFGTMLAVGVSLFLCRLFYAADEFVFRLEKSEKKNSVTKENKAVAADTKATSDERTIITAEKNESIASIEKAEKAGGLPFLEEGVSLEDYLFGNNAENQESSENVGETEAIEESTVEKKDATNVVISEPTAEELKRRLNQLLKGEM